MSEQHYLSNDEEPNDRDPSQAQSVDARHADECLEAPDKCLQDVDMHHENVDMHHDGIDVHDEVVHMHNQDANDDVGDDDVGMHDKVFGTRNEGVDIHNERVGVDDENVDIHDESVDVHNESVDVHNESVDVHHESVDVHHEDDDVEDDVDLDDEVAYLDDVDVDEGDDEEEYEDEDAQDDEPQFGLVDVIEAFTAMRQEWRTQSRESRDLSQSLVDTSCGIAELEQRLLSATTKIQEVAAAATSDDMSRRLAETIAEIDQHVVRAAQAVARAAAVASDREGLKNQLTADVQSLGAIGRWFTGRIIAKIESTVHEWVKAETRRTADPTRQGLQMLVDRVERLMTDQDIERIETVGQLFDGQTMNAVEAVETSAQPSGRVVEQLAPAYRWRGQLIKYAQVRIAK